MDRLQPNRILLASLVTPKAFGVSSRTTRAKEADITRRGCSSHPFEPYDVVVLGAGYAGLMAALRMARRKSDLRIALVSARDQFVERVRLQEGIVAVVPARIPSVAVFLRDNPVEFICGTILVLDADRRRIHVAMADGAKQELSDASGPLARVRQRQARCGSAD